MPTSHLAILEASSLIYPQRPVFRVPTVNKETGKFDSWESISYRQFQLDVERFARFWQSKLLSDGIPPQSVIGVWYVSICITVIWYLCALKDRWIHVYGRFTYLWSLKGWVHPSIVQPPPP